MPLFRGFDAIRLLRRRVKSSAIKAQSVSSFSRAINVSEPLEAYELGGYHPTHLEDLIDGRYHVLQKLGHGFFATVWLARDQRTERYVALKISASSWMKESKREGAFLKSLNERQAQVPIIRVCDTLTIHGPNGAHHILALEPAGRTLSEWIQYHQLVVHHEGGRLRTNLVRDLAKRMVMAVAYIHSMGIVHRDLQPHNFMFTLAKSVDGVSFGDMQERLRRHRSEYTILKSEQPVSHSQSRDSRKPRYLLEAQCLANDPRDMTPERLVLADFGTATTLSEVNDGGHGFPLDARAPEIVLDMPMSASADIWALGCAIFHVATIGPLFEVDTFMSQKDQDDEHLTCMIEVLGPMPQHLLKQWTGRHRYVNEEGVVPEDTEEGPFGELLGEQIVKRKPSDMSEEESRQFEDLIRRMCHWIPEERPTADQILEHPWFTMNGGHL